MMKDATIVEKRPVWLADRHRDGHWAEQMKTYEHEDTVRVIFPAVG